MWFRRDEPGVGEAGAEFVGGEGAGEVVALPLVAAERLELESCSRVSMPSLVICKFSVFASVTMARTMAASSSCSPILLTNERSILSVSMGRMLR